MHASFSYQKKEKLKSRKQLELLFSGGSSILVHPFKIFFSIPEEPLDFYIKTGVGVSSKVFKKAVERNRVKRLLREVYRLNKQPLHDYLQEQKLQLIVFILYIGKELPKHAVLEIKMPLAIEKLIKVLNEKPAANN